MPLKQWDSILANENVNSKTSNIKMTEGEMNGKKCKREGFWGKKLTVLIKYCVCNACLYMLE